MPGSYREVFSALAQGDGPPADLRDQLVAACGMHTVLTHLYDTIDLDRIIAAVDPAMTLYQRFGAWAAERIADLAQAQASGADGAEGGQDPT